jgi:hypothetical protein
MLLNNNRQWAKELSGKVWYAILKISYAEILEEYVKVGSRKVAVNVQDNVW